MPSFAPFLIRRGDTYAFRIAVPAELRGLLDCRELTRTLRVAHKRDAVPMALEMAAISKRLFSLLREHSQTMSDKDGLKALIDQTKRRLRTVAAQEQQEKELDDLRAKHLRDAEQIKHTAMAELLDAMMRSGSLPLPGAATAPSPATPTTAPASRPAKHHRLSELVPIWEMYKTPSKATKEIYAHAVRRFEGRHPGLMVETIEKRHIRDHVSWLLSEGKNGKTIEKEHGAIRALLNIAIDQEWVVSNAASRVLLPKTKPSKEPRSFTLDELNTIFASDVFEKGLRPASGKGEAAFWIPLLLLFTGARREEIGQLSPDRVKTTEDIHYLILDPIDDDGALKTDESCRSVPLHPDLIRIGFLDYVTKQRKAKQRLLFPGLKPNKRGQYCAKWGDWWRLYIRKALNLTDRNIQPCHSFRHTFVTECRRLRFRLDYEMALVGHKSVVRDIHDKYGEFLVPELYNDVKQINFRGLDLSPLYAEDFSEEAPTHES